MIESISVANAATYASTPETLNDLSLFNYIFGSNATGKTTISRIIANEPAYPACRVTWKNGTRLEAVVYNHDFVERNLTQPPELKGVFTLGEKQAEAISKIAGAKKDLDDMNRLKEGLTLALGGLDGTGGKQADLQALEDAFKDKCWSQKQKHDLNLQGAFEGYRNSSEKFKAKVLTELAANTATLLTKEELEQKAATVFAPAPATETPNAAIDTTRLVAHEANPILQKRVVGKDDVDIAAMITRLGNGDWVRTGKPFYDANQRICPFCQQQTTAMFAKSLADYFDDTFTADTAAIEALATAYEIDSANLQRQLEAIIAAPSKFLDAESLKTKKQGLDAKISLNNQLLATKKKEPSQPIELQQLAGLATDITSIIDCANSQVAAHNKMVRNLPAERAALTAEVWKFVIDELKIEIAAYLESKQSQKKAIAAMAAKIKRFGEDIEKKTTEIRQLERQTTSIQPTIDAINQLLAAFGFQGFKLAKAASGRCYRLVRSDGSDAKATLSEGEKTFVAFLYFYHLLKGSDSETGMTNDRIVVFDDPVSSLDSDILFIVGTLIRGLFEEVRKSTGHIKQIFVLTHNVYFHKEVTYNPKRKDTALSEETFWIVKKPGHVSKIQRHPTNPIKTSYEMLWADVRKPDRSNPTIQNTLRRILENYYKILGGIDFERLCNLFEGRERLICRSLCSWVHDGSHYAYDDIYVSMDPSMVEAYLAVFHKIFTKSNQEEHYKMMMGDSYIAEPSQSQAEHPPGVHPNTPPAAPSQPRQETTHLNP